MILKFNLAAAATKGETEKAEAEQTKKVSLLVAEGHVTYQYDDLLERINKLLKDKNPLVFDGKSSIEKKEDPNVVKLGTTKTAW